MTKADWTTFQQMVANEIWQRFGKDGHAVVDFQSEIGRLRMVVQDRRDGSPTYFAQTLTDDDFAGDQRALSRKVVEEWHQDCQAHDSTNARRESE